ncbi:MAG: CocE/NonD family hydrolase [Chloroflexota bacterium]|nr:CocE/NonD family hydrolase [Chloroflexota bacterium]
MSRWFKIGLAAAITIPLAILGISSYLAYSMTRVVRVAIDDNPTNQGLNCEDVSFPAAIDGLMIQAWYIMAKDSNRCIIMTHGAEQHRADPHIKMLEIARGLVEHGYSILMLDLRGHGKSEGKTMSGGYYERRDIRGAIAYIKGRGILPQHIGALGFSIGAVASLLAAADDEDLAAVVTDSCCADMKALIENRIAKQNHLPQFIIPITLSIARKAYGIDFNDVRPLSAVHKIAPRPLFFIHGEFDETVPVEHALRLYHSSNNPNNRLWIVPEAGHVGSYEAQPEEYITKVANFFDEALK